MSGSGSVKRALVTGGSGGIGGAICRRLARDELGEVSLIATDLLDFLPRAIRQFQTG